MSEDRLSEATRALREVAEVSEFEARATRARIMSGLHQTRVRRRTRYAFLLPIAATFVAASAWGAASGKATLVWTSIARLVTQQAPASQPAKTSSAITNANPTLEATPVPSESAAVTEVSPESAASPNSASIAPRSSAALPGPSVKAVVTDAHSLAPQTAEERADPTLALYRVAHTAHFVDRDPARALAAWDAYLTAAPNGTFAPEARYNRALSLVRLGRNSEAKAALEPFASGVYGNYRQAEASALLQRLE